MPYQYSGKMLREGRGWTDNDGIKHPANWATAWSDADKAAKGLVWVDPAPVFDNRFYWASGVPKTLEDVAEVDENGDPVLDEDGNQVVTKGLKTLAIAKIKDQAKGLLEPTDWWVLRAFEDPGKPIDLTVKSKRAAIRSKSNEIEGLITACVTLEDFINLHETPVDVNGEPTGNAPISDWPK